MQIAKKGKISASTVIGAPKDIRKLAESGKGKNVDIMRIVGVAIATKTGMSHHGEWVALRGNFSAINIETGEEYRGTTLYVPDEITDMIAAQLASSSSVEFGVMIGVKESDLVIGYEYTVTMLMDAGEGDPIAALNAKIDNRLGAPEKDTKGKDKAKDKK